MPRKSKWIETWDLGTIPDDLLKSEWARRSNAKRKTHAAGPGRPKSDSSRCPCGEMTLKRAAARKHRCVAPTP